jgi:hypothetical protein
VVICYLGLAYSLYLLKHNVELQARLIKRLKNAAQFQGAYYELIVANCLIRAGFELALENEQDESKKHCEFSAISRTGKKYWIEAKMRGVAGVLGKTTKDGAPSTSKPTGRLMAHISEAFAKPASDERLIFVDVNTAPLEIVDGKPVFSSWMNAVGPQLDAREKALKDGERAYVFVTNMSFHQALDEPARGQSLLAHGLGISDFGKVGTIRVIDAWKQKRKHVDAYQIAESFQKYPQIPITFDGSLPIDANNRIEIGERYFFPNADGQQQIGVVETATVSEPERKMYIIALMEDGKRNIIKKEMSDDELAAYRAHPDAYFGVIHKVGKQTEDPYELFEWFVETSMSRSRENILKQLENHPDYEMLQTLEHEELVLIYSENLLQWAMAKEKKK